MPHEGEEFLIVIEGKVSFEYDGEIHELLKGDAVYFDAEVDHRLFNTHESDASVLCVFLGRPM